ncbi:MAG TPA: phosphatase PAP2 family protein, partial [Rhizomicrobium sp.]|nr:phosphatase PAP2 family protein [Rhizomicrobium sp.]
RFFVRPALAAFALMVLSGAASADTIKSTGTDVAIALPLVAAGVSLYEDDRMGLAQLTVDTVATVGTAFALKHVVHEQRPNHTDFQSFPSDTSALAFAPAQYLWDRYGWEYGVPAYAAAIYTGYSRVEAKEHHWYDVAASAGIAFGFSKIFTTRYHPPGLIYGAEVLPGGGYVHLSYNF